MPQIEVNMIGKYKIITLCGNSRFKEEFLKVQKKLTLEGNIVISVESFEYSSDTEVLRNVDEGTLIKTKDMLDDMHKRKIDMADEIYVVDVDGDIDESTKSEIKYAKKIGREIQYFSNDASFKNISCKKFDFQKLTPTVHADMETYAEALDFVFDEKNYDVQNIAITGIYGSGKSSIINTYEKIRKKKFIHISLSHFDEVQNEDEEEILEKKIVNQLMQQIPENIIPETKFRIKHEFNKTTTLWTVIKITMAMVLGFFVVEFDKISSAITSIHFHTIQFLTSFPAYSMAYVALILLLANILYSVIKWQKQSHFISKVAYKGSEIDMEDYKDDKSYFNRHSDEILYLLEKIANPSKKNLYQKYDGVVFEDLDRFGNSIDTKVFEKLRELCSLGNDRILRNSSNIHYPLRFFYLLSDDTFLSKERTKFFDYIVPIIPVVDSSNAYAKIKDCLQKADYYDALDDRFLRGLSLYFDDYRLIKNIVNEFQIYASKLSHTEHDYDKLLAIIVYKNYFPQDFASLQLHDGYVYSVFEKRKNLVEQEKKSLIDDKESLKLRLTSMNNEMLANQEELQSVVNDRRNCSYNYKDMNYSKWQKEVYPRRRQAIQDRDEHNEREIREKIVDLDTEIIHINNKQFNNLINKENQEEVFNINEKNNDSATEGSIQYDKYFDVIRYLIFSGYLDDLSYRDYMACFDENGMSLNDKSFLISINNRNGREFDYKLDNVSLVFANLESDDFLLPAIRNFELTDYIVRTHQNNAIESFVFQMREKIDYEYIGQYLRNTNYYNEFCSEICKLWDGFLDVVISGDNQEMSLDEVQHIVITALLICSNETVQQQNESGILTKYLSSSTENISCDDCKAVELAEQFMNLKVKIDNLDTQIISKAVRMEVIKRSSYRLSYENLRSILMKDFQYSQKKVSMSFLSLLLRDDKKSLYTYVMDNLKTVVKLIIDNTREAISDEKTTVSMITMSDIDEKVILEYLNRSTTIIEDLNNVNPSFWHIFAEKHTFTETTDNVLKYYEKNKLDDSLIDYLNGSDVGETMSFSNAMTGVDSFWHDVYKENSFSDDIYRILVEEIGTNIVDFNVPELDENKCEILLQNNLIAMTTSNINIFRTNYPKLVHKFICTDIDNYIALAQNQMYSINEVVDILNEGSINEKHKVKLLRETTEKISVFGEKYSDSVFEEILSNHFDINDFSYLSKNYDNYNEDCCSAIYKQVVLHKQKLLETCADSSNKLLMKFFGDESISLQDKSLIVENLIKAGKSFEVISELLVAADEDVLAKLFRTEKSRMSLISNDAGHVALLKVLKENGIIDNFSEENNQLKIRRK